MPTNNNEHDECPEELNDGYTCFSCGTNINTDEELWVSVYARNDVYARFSAEHPRSARVITGYNSEVAYCGECAVMCERCGHVMESGYEYYSELANQSMCSDCWHDRFFTCDGCSQETRNSDANSDGFATYCGDCYEPEEEEEDDYYDGDRRSGRNERLPNGRLLIMPYQRTDDDDPHFNFTEYRELPDGNDLSDGRFTVTGIKRFALIKHDSVPDKFPGIGFELELKMRDTTKRNSAARWLLEGLRDDYLVLKEDGTVNGWEQVTYVADYRAHMELYPWDKLPMLAKDWGMYAWNDRDKMCGLHIHISRDAFKPSHLHRFVTFHDNHVEQLVKFSGRHNRSYAAHGRDYYDNRKEQALGRQRGSRSVAVNLTNDKTVELRYFRGSLLPTTVKAAVQFTHALWLFTKDMTSNDVRYGANTFDKFVEFAGENTTEYPDLLPRLVARGVAN